MAAAVCRIGYWNGASPTFTGGGDTGVSAESGFVFNRADSLTDTAANIPVPTAAGTNYSWIKNLGLQVTTVGTTSINNRRLYLGSAPTTGLTLFYKSVASGSYTQAASGSKPADNATTNGATPAGYTAMATSLGGASAYDNTTVATSTLGLNGTLAVCVLGADFTFDVANVGTGVAVPDFKLTFDEF
jgi:hypothetical protein